MGLSFSPPQQRGRAHGPSVTVCPGCAWGAPALLRLEERLRRNETERPFSSSVVPADLSWGPGDVKQGRPQRPCNRRPGWLRAHWGRRRQGPHVTPPCCPGRRMVVYFQVQDLSPRAPGLSGRGARGVGLVVGAPPVSPRDRTPAPPARWFYPSLGASRRRGLGASWPRNLLPGRLRMIGEAVRSLRVRGSHCCVSWAG